MTFTLHPRLAADTALVCDLDLCRVLLMEDANYPWLILVPRRPAIQEIHQLDGDDRALLIQEMALIAERAQDFFQADKMNVAALGNVVEQLHIHVIARFKHDRAWPKPVWGVLPAKAYEPEQRQKTIEGLRHILR